MRKCGFALQSLGEWTSCGVVSSCIFYYSQQSLNLQVLLQDLVNAFWALIFERHSLDDLIMSFLSMLIGTRLVRFCIWGKWSKIDQPTLFLSCTYRPCCAVFDVWTGNGSVVHSSIVTELWLWQLVLWVFVESSCGPLLGSHNLNMIHVGQSFLGFVLLPILWTPLGMLPFRVVFCFSWLSFLCCCLS